jgi:hypothetical protein
VPVRLFGQHVAVDVMIAVLEEDRLAAIAPLGHVMRNTWNHDASETGHQWRLVDLERKGST